MAIGDLARSSSICESLRRFDTATVSNAIEGFGVRDRTKGYASADIACQFPELEPMVGYAVTCTVDNTTPGPRPTTKLDDLIDALAGASKPAVIVCQYVGPNPRRGCFAGDMAATLFRRLGAVGLVTDAPNRDIASWQARARGFQLFGAGMVASHGNGAIVSVGITVEIGGMTVAPGDLLHGDINGVIVVPLQIAGDLAAAANRVLEEEREEYAMLIDPTTSVQTIKDRFIH